MCDHCCQLAAEEVKWDKDEEKDDFKEFLVQL